MDIIFIILCSIIFLSPYALVSKVLAGMILVALFEIISKNTNTIKLFGRINKFCYECIYSNAADDC